MGLRKIKCHVHCVCKGFLSAQVLLDGEGSVDASDLSQVPLPSLHATEISSANSYDL